MSSKIEKWKKRRTPAEVFKQLQKRGVKAAAEGSLEERSIGALENYFERLKGIYGGDGIICDASFNIHRPDGGSLSKMLGKLKSALAGEAGKSFEAESSQTPFLWK